MQEVEDLKLRTKKWDWQVSLSEVGRKAMAYSWKASFCFNPKKT